MTFYPNTDEDRREMLETIGVKQFEDLIREIPDEIRLKGNLKIPEAMSELEVLAHLSTLAKKNISASDSISFLGAGVYDHFVPSVIGAMLSRSEYYTAYTPYQAEVSQGTLQSIYEYQTMVCRLTGMDVSNASMYDAGSALAEAALLSASYTGRRKIVVAHPVNPLYVRVVKTYCHGQGFEVVEVPPADGIINAKAIEKVIDDQTASLIVQQPSFFGTLSEVSLLSELVHSKGSIFIANVNPISLGILKPPSEYGADVVVGEGQPLGIQQNFGGPFLGIFAVKEFLIRRIPGRLAGLTVDASGERGFVLTLQTREQQIRRERATSNICTNEGLMMLASTIYMSLMGKEGIREVAFQSTAKAHYLADQISRIPGYRIKYHQPFFNEFLLTTPVAPSRIIEAGISENFLAGVDVSVLDSFESGLLVAVTEKRTRAEIDAFVKFLKKFSNP